MASNAASLSQLLPLRRDALRRLFVRAAGPDAWEDLYQMLWIRVQRVADDPPIRDHHAFLFYLAQLVALDHGRREMRQRRLQKAICHVMAKQERVIPVDEVAIAREELDRLIDAARQIVEPTRTIFYLNRMEQVPQREIARRMGLSKSAVDRHIAKALKLLCNILNDVRRAGEKPVVTEPRNSHSVCEAIVGVD